MTHIKPLLSTLLSLAPSLGWSQGSQADYERADGLRKRFEGKAYNTQVQPRWIKDTSQFWYQVNVAGEAHRFVHIDPEEGTRWETTDRKALDIRIGVEPDNSSVRVLNRIRGSSSRGPETEITFINALDRPVELYWVSDPKRPQRYGDVAPGKTFAQHTYAGHVWLVKDAEEQLLGVFEAADLPGKVVIDGSWKPQKEPKKTQKKREKKDSHRFSSPDGRWIIEIVNHNVRIIDQETNEAHSLTSKGTADDAFIERVHWSPDSKKVVVLQTVFAKKRVVYAVESSPKDQLQPRLHSFDYTKPGDTLDHSRPRLFDVAERREIPVSDDLFANPFRMTQYQWSADSSQFTFLYNQRGHQILRLVSIDSDTGSARSLIEEAPETFVCYSQKFYYQRKDATNEIIWMSERSGWNHLYLFDSKTGTLKNAITEGQWVVRKVEHVDWKKRQIWLQVGGINAQEDPYHLHHARVNFDGTEMVRLTNGNGTHQVTYSPDRRFFIDTYSRVDLPPVTELRRSSDGKIIMTLERADISALLEAGWRAPERFTSVGRDGRTQIYGIIHTPTNFDPLKTYPVIEKIYAGPHAAHVPKRFSSSGSTMAELGFIVVQIDGMGTSHRSKAFHDVCWQNIGDSGFPDRILWIQAAAETRPWMDLSRVGIYGGSAGGQSAMRALIAHHDFYHVAVADCGCHDNRMDKIWWNEQWMGYPIGTHYAESSNVDQAHRLEGKLMLIVGELDRNVDPASTMQVADALIKADKDFDLVFMPGAGHGAAGTAYGRRRQRDFFVRHLWSSEPRRP